MKTKLSVTALAALYAAGIGASVQAGPVFPAAEPFSAGNAPTLQAVNISKKSAKSFVRAPLSSKINIEKGLTGTHSYIVRLVDQAVASYDGHLPQYKATNPRVAQKFGSKSFVQKGQTKKQIKQSLKLDVKKPEVKAYTQYLDSKQQTFLTQASAKASASLVASRSLKYALNGVVVKMTQEQAIKVAGMNSVAFVERDLPKFLNTDTGPTLIGSPNVWDGTATGVENQGEGVILGIIDTGINTDHPSFAATGGDGFVHSNPFGTGVFAGDCANSFPGLCNDKLIGVHSYGWVTDVYADVDVFGATPPDANGEDYNGHGSHTASTAGGNTLLDVDLLDPESGMADSDGVNSTGFKFPKISGVAPHANIIAYQVCRPGNSGDTYAGCSGGGSTLAAIDDAIAEGVDVLNYSIGGTSDINPWQNAEEQAFLNANAAGIFVATSAGNSGPGPHTAFKPSPWYAAVAASTHGRTISFDFTFDGNDFTYAQSDGPAFSDSITAPVIYSGVVDAANFEGCTAFAPDSFANSMALISRGACSFADKINNAADAGAVAVVVFNNTDGNVPIAMGGTSETTIPSAGISQNAGASVVESLAVTPGIEGTINTLPNLNFGQADDIASFSSRGPTNFPDIIVPSVAAPGVSIYAAYADQHRGHDVTGNSPSDLAFLSGTSMAGPHVAGAGALLKSAHPTWTPDNIRSALMMTATQDVRKEDGVTPADALDMGAGRIRVDMAINAGLVMDETFANYQAANPDEGGDPTTLNIASMGNGACPRTCSWERTFTATVDADWTTSGFSNTGGFTVTVSPESFSLVAGETQTVTVTADMTGFSTGEAAFGGINLTASSASIPAAHLPIYAVANTSTIPAIFEANINRSAGSVIIPDVTALEITDFTTSTFGLTKATVSQLFSVMDSDNSSAYDDITDGQTLSWVNLSADSLMLLVELANSESPDLDLRVGLDDGDGVPQEDEEVCEAATGAANERCEIPEAEAGNYWVLVQNWQSSGEDAVDAYDLLTGYVSDQSQGNFTVSAQSSSISEQTPFDIRVIYNDDMVEGDVFIGAFESGSSAEDAGNLGTSVVILRRDADDVSLQADVAEAAVGDKVNYTINVAQNTSREDLTYILETTIPAGITLDTDSVTASSGELTVAGNGFVWSGVQVSEFGPNVLKGYNTTDNRTDATCALPDFGQGGGYLDLALFGIGPSDVDGDTTTGSFGVGATFLGDTYDGITVTDDGFIFFSGSSGSAPWNNQFLPDAAEANNLVAPFWRDMFFDVANGSTLSVATAGPITIVEWDDMHHWQFINSGPFVDDIADFQVVFDNTNGDIMYAYDNVTHTFGDQLGGTVGWENAAGSNGANYVYVGADQAAVGSVTEIQSGLIICNTFFNNVTPVVISFSGTVTNAAAGDSISPMVTSRTNNFGSVEASTGDEVRVASNLAITPIDNTSIAEDTMLTGVTVEVTDNDAVANTITVSSDSGTLSDVVDAAFDLTPDADFYGDITVTVTVTDNDKPADSTSSSFVVTVTPVNDAPVAAASSTGGDQVGQGNLSLSAAASSDIDGDDLTFSWSQISGPTVTMSGTSSANASVGSEDLLAGSLEFQVVVSDGMLTDTATVVVAVSDRVGRDNGPFNSGGSVGLFLLGLLGLGAYARRRRTM